MLPPLRERLEDIEGLTRSFVHQMMTDSHRSIPEIDPIVFSVFQRYSWPGNVRELRNILLRALTQLESSRLSMAEIDLPDLEQVSSHLNVDDGLSLDAMMDAYEASILNALYQTYPSSRKLAKRLEMSHTAIANKLRQYGIGKL